VPHDLRVEDLAVRLDRTVAEQLLAGLDLAVDLDAALEAQGGGELRLGEAMV